MSNLTVLLEGEERERYIRERRESFHSAAAIASPIVKPVAKPVVKPIRRRPTGIKRYRNTTVTDDGSRVVVRLHHTNIFVLDRSTGGVTLNSGGWRTVTTKRRINECLAEYGIPLRVWQSNFDWYVYRMDSTDRPGPNEFVDGKVWLTWDGWTPFKLS